MKPIEVITNESHDWVIIRKGNVVLHESHSISITDFCWVLRELGLTVKDVEVPDHVMESL